jgi:hypothetical protein
MRLRAGDWVEVRSKEEILRTLDGRGRLENLPFMPQMLQFCGQRFRVVKRAHKTCDTVNVTGGVQLERGIHLENLRCDGQAYGGCQAACLIFWKEDWLKRSDKAPHSADPGEAAASLEKGPNHAAKCTEQAILAGTLAEDQPASGGPRFSCQATDLPQYTKPLPWWDARQYLEDYSSRNVPLRRLVAGFIYACFFYGTRPSRNPWHRQFRLLYDRFQKITGGTPFPRRFGQLPTSQKAPVVDLDLQAGDLVRVKSYGDILATLDTNNRNRGLLFDAEMVPFCGRTFEVKARISRFVNEQTGIMTMLKTPAVMLENVWCQSRYSDCRMFCPRSIYSWWREAWLERVSAAPPARKHDNDTERARLPASQTLAALLLLLSPLEMIF